MPIYEYLCPKHGKFEVAKAISERHFGLCSCCELIPSIFVRAKLNWTQKDGEGFTTKWVRKEELAEMNQECRER